MPIAVLLFAFGVWLCQQQATLPETEALLGCSGVIGVLWALSLWRRCGLSARRVAAGVALFLAGFVWAAGFGQWRLAQALASVDEGRDIAVIGVVASLPQVIDRGRRFDFDIEQVLPDEAGRRAALPEHVSLAWYKGRQELVSDEDSLYREVHAGERWRLTVRLKKPHGNLNPNGFDMEAWLFERGVRATGYVRTRQLSFENERLDEFVRRPGYGVERLREAIRDRIFSALQGGEYAGILAALVVGDQQAIDGELWTLFAQVGITHLVAISGLHVTLIAALGYGLVSFVWRRRPGLALRLPTQKAAAVGGALTAFAYCLLAGYGVPAQRTLYMLSVVALALWSGRQVAGRQVLALALLVVLLLDPLAVLAAGFWLSFGAVSLLFYVSAGRLQAYRWWAEWGRTQWAVTLGMIPALLALFQQFSLISPLANIVAIPVITFAVTPLALFGAVLPFDSVLVFAHWILEWLMRAMVFLAGLPLAVWQQAAPPVWTVLLGTLGGVVLLLPRGFPARWVGAFMLLPLVLIRPERPAPGEMKLTVLDVGQGLAVHVQTANADLIYDTGPQFSLDANSGNRIILPYLRAAGVVHLNGLIVTHQDMDHSGGAASLLQGIGVDWIASSLPPEHFLLKGDGRHRPCFAGQSWTWDGVRFDMLYPVLDAYARPERKTNDMSCVLRITSAGGAALLTSDIEALSESRLLQAQRGQMKPAHPTDIEALSESRLVRDQGAALRAEVMLMPHHGSRTSSTPDFIDAVGAQTVVIPVGYRSRYRHPVPEVVERYRVRGMRILRTDLDGAVSLDFAQIGITPTRERSRQHRYWHDR